MKTFFFLLGIFFSMNSLSQSSPFIFAKGKQFILDGKSYHYLGTNFWYGMNLASKGAGGDRKRLVKELDQLKNLGINNLRIMAASEGPDHSEWRVSPTLQYAPGKYNNELLDGLDFLLSEMAKRKMYAVVCLNNFWPWSGGMAQYHAWTNNDNIPYPPPAKKGKWLKYMLFSARFYSNQKAIEYYHDFVKYIVSRTNSYTGIAYKDDPCIMSWQIANEPRGMTKRKKYLAFLLA
ncbi:MAG TPA: hypothetical protein ENJ53_06640, partial [Phaeodactylibacter sp.]|nr:hypothetical protein [Phaeodactylibacter sp.]